MRDYSQHLPVIVKHLRAHGNVKKVVGILRNRGVPKTAAEELVLQVRRQLKWEIRKAGIGKLVFGGIVSAVFIWIFLTTGVLFWYIIPVALLGFLWGLIQVVFGIEAEDERPTVDY